MGYNLFSTDRQFDAHLKHLTSAFPILRMVGQGNMATQLSLNVDKQLLDALLAGELTAVQWSHLNSLLLLGKIIAMRDPEVLEKCLKHWSDGDVPAKPTGSAFCLNRTLGEGNMGMGFKMLAPLPECKPAGPHRILLIPASEFARFYKNKPRQTINRWAKNGVLEGVGFTINRDVTGHLFIGIPSSHEDYKHFLVWASRRQKLKTFQTSQMSQS